MSTCPPPRRARTETMIILLTKCRRLLLLHFEGERALSLLVELGADFVRADGGNLRNVEALLVQLLTSLALDRINDIGSRDRAENFAVFTHSLLHDELADRRERRRERLRILHLLRLGGSRGRSLLFELGHQFRAHLGRQTLRLEVRTEETVGHLNHVAFLTDIGRLEKDSLGLLHDSLVSLDDETDAAAGSRKRGRRLGNLHRVKRRRSGQSPHSQERNVVSHERSPERPNPPHPVRITPAACRRRSTRRRSERPRGRRN